MILYINERGLTWWRVSPNFLPQTHRHVDPDVCLTEDIFALIWKKDEEMIGRKDDTRKYCNRYAVEDTQKF
jgi:hypothetical protein